MHVGNHNIVVVLSVATSQVVTVGMIAMHAWLYHVCRWRGINRGTWVDELFTGSSSAVNVISPNKVSAKRN